MDNGRSQAAQRPWRAAIHSIGLAHPKLTLGISSACLFVLVPTHIDVDNSLLPNVPRAEIVRAERDPPERQSAARARAAQAFGSRTLPTGLCDRGKQAFEFGSGPGLWAGSAAALARKAGADQFTAGSMKSRSLSAREGCGLLQRGKPTMRRAPLCCCATLRLIAVLPTELKVPPPRAPVCTLGPRASFERHELVRNARGSRASARGDTASRT
jgi:hypothetical protein